MNELELIGYDGVIESLSAESIIHGWKEAGWVKISPNGLELRLTEAGIEQFAQWNEEDTLTDTKLPLPSLVSTEIVP